MNYTVKVYLIQFPFQLLLRLAYSSSYAGIIHLMINAVNIKAYCTNPYLPYWPLNLYEYPLKPTGKILGYTRVFWVFQLLREREREREREEIQLEMVIRHVIWDNRLG